MSCGEVCSSAKKGEKCKFCEEELQKRWEEARNAAIEIARKNKVRLEKGEAICKPLDPDHPDFVSISDKVLRSIQPGHNMNICVERIDEVVATSLERNYWGAVEEMFGPGENLLKSRELYHGTATKNVEGILKTGFKISRKRNRRTHIQQVKS
jgi:hypothetical protein